MHAKFLFRVKTLLPAKNREFKDISNLAKSMKNTKMLWLKLPAIRYAVNCVPAINNL
jgi:hypothetical protein